MPIQVPIIQRNNVPEQQSVGRMSTQTIDVGPAQAMQTKAVNNFAETIGKVVDQEQEITADTKSTEAATKFTIWYNENLRGKDGVAYKKGDPVEAYKTFDDNAKKQYDALLEESSTYSERTRQAIASKLNKTYNGLYESRVTLEGKQNADYRTTVANDGVYLSQNRVVDATAHLDINDKNAKVPIDSALNEIVDLRYNEAKGNGRLKEILDPNGEIDPNTKQVKIIKVESDNSYKAQVAKDVSDALVLAVNNLTAAGDVGGAEFIMKEYGNRIIGKQKDNVTKEVEKASDVQAAQQMVRKLVNLSPKEAQAKIDEMTDDGARELTSKHYDSEMRRRKNLVDRASATNFDAAIKVILNKRFQDVTEMQDDPEIKRLLPYITNARQQMALEHAVTQPKDSDQDVKRAALQDLIDGKFEGMPVAKFSEMMGGLNKSDRTMFETEYRKANVKTDAKEKAEIKWMGVALERELQNIKYIKKPFGFYSEKDKIKLNEAQSELVIALDKMPVGVSYKDKQEWIKKFATEKIKEGGNAPDLPSNGGTTKLKYKDMTFQQKVEASAEFKKVNGRIPDLKTGELEKFVNEGSK